MHWATQKRVDSGASPLQFVPLWRNIGYSLQSAQEPISFCAPAIKVVLEIWRKPVILGQSVVCRQ